MRPSSIISFLRVLSSASFSLTFLLRSVFTSVSSSNSSSISCCSFFFLSLETWQDYDQISYNNAKIDGPNIDTYLSEWPTARGLNPNNFKHCWHCDRHLGYDLSCLTQLKITKTNKAKLSLTSQYNPKLDHTKEFNRGGKIKHRKLKREGEDMTGGRQSLSIK